MSNSINRIDGKFRGLTVHNKDRNILNMSQDGNYNLSTKNIENISFNRLTNISESLGEKSLCLYSNNGLSQSSHGSMNMISDNDIIVQTSNKLNLTSLGYILLNSERLLGSIEEDIILLSSTGELKFGGNGVTTIGMKINTTTKNNYLSIGKFSDTADRNLHININEKSYDKNKKNGLLIDSKNKNNDSTYPELTLNNYNKSEILETSSSLGIGSDENDSNNLVFVKKENNSDNTKTFIVSLNNFDFTQTDVNRIITYTDTTLSADTITAIDTSDSKKVEIKKLNTQEQITAFNLKPVKGYINRDNFSYLKTTTDSDLVLGINNLNTINIKNTGNIGINKYNPTATLELNNNYGEIQNIRIDSDKEYRNPRAVQMNNGNYIVIYVTKKNLLFNLEASIYNINNNFIKNFIIYSGSTIFIDFDIDNLLGTEDKFVICYSYQIGNYVTTRVDIYDNLGIKDLIKYTKVHNSLDKSSRPRVKSYSLVSDSTTNTVVNGYLLGYLEKNDSNEINMDFSLFTNDSASIQENFNIIDKINSKIGTENTIEERNILSFDLEYSQQRELIMIQILI